MIRPPSPAILAVAMNFRLTAIQLFVRVTCSVVWAWLFLATAAPAMARQVPITIVHTTDLHGHVWPARDYDGNEGVGGLLRAATVITQWREQHPHLLLVDCGDLYQGAIESYLTEGQIMNAALEWLGYDAWVLGNHEFDWGLDVLARAVRASPAPVLAANMQPRPGTAHPLPQVRPYLIRQVEGVRVALVGLTTDAIPNWSRPHLLGDLIFTDSVDALRRWLPHIRAERPDVMVLLAHQGFRPFGDSPANQINRIARHFPEFDLILGGHSHQAQAQARVNGIPYSQAGYYGIWVGKATLVYDTVTRTVIDHQLELAEIDAHVPKHAGLQDALQEDLERARRLGSQAIGVATQHGSYRSRYPGHSAIQQLIAGALARAAGTPIALHGILAAEELSAGTVYERDLWRIVPYENTIGVLQLTAADIRAILEDNALLDRSSTQFLGVYGLRYELHGYAPPGERVRHLRHANGDPIHPRARLPVALNSYVLASGGLRFPAARRLADDPITRLHWVGQDTRSAVRAYIKQHSPLTLDAEPAVEWFPSPPPSP